MFSPQDHHWMQEALKLAQRAAEQGEVPVGAIVVLDDKVIGEGWNQPLTQLDPTAHAEVLALRDAAKRSANYRLTDAMMYVTLEPCFMCAGAIIHSRLARVLYGAKDLKAGAAESLTCAFMLNHNHHVAVKGGLLAQASSELLSNFFQAKRA